MKNLYVGKMEASTTDDDLKTAFAAYGTVGTVTIVKDKAIGVPCGFAFVEMSDDKVAQEANWV